MTRRKIVYVIVEGPSDDAALGVILNRFYDKNAVYVEITHGDITSDRSVNPANIVAKLGKLMQSYAKSNHYKAADFQEVIHVIDMDGAYVPESAVKEDKNAAKPFYTTTEICTDKRKQLLQRNQRKQENINRICGLNKIWNSIPYRAYYMSCNLDHVLYNKLNSSDDEKENDAYMFARKYKDHLQEFLVFITASDFAVQGEFKDTWDYIRQGKHSLERHTNFGICFQKDEIPQKATKKIETTQEV